MLCCRCSTRIALLALVILQAICPAIAHPRGICPGEQLYSEGRYREAMAWYVEQCKSSGKEPELFYNLGNIHYQLGEYTRARGYWHKAIARGRNTPLHARALYNIGNSFFRENRFRDAAAFYLEALRIDPEDKDARLNLAKSLQKRDRAVQGGGDKKKDSAQQVTKDGRNRAAPGKDSAGRANRKQALSPGKSTSGSRCATSRRDFRCDKVLSREEVDYLLGSVAEGKRKSIPFPDKAARKSDNSVEDW